MKTSSLLLVGSLAANVALAAVFVVGFSSAQATRPNSMPPGHPAGASGADAKSTAAAAVDPASWSHLQTDDLHAFMDRLRAEGFPPAMLRAIMAEQIRIQFAPRRAALDRKGAERPFWEPTANDAKTAMALRQIMKEQNQAVKDLLGPDPAAEELAMSSLRRQFPGLSDDKIGAINRIKQAINEQQGDLFAGVSGVAPPDVTAKLRELTKAEHDEIAKTLTPQELEEYDLRTSSTASQLRYQLTAFNPTEQEFRTLFELQNQYSDQLGPMYSIPSQDEMKARADVQKQLNEQIVAALGPDRGADYTRAQDYNYRQTSQLVTRLDLPPETANDIYSLQKDIQQRANAVRMDRTLSPDVRTQQLAALADETKAKVTASLGETGFEAYKQYGGSWMQALQPPVRPASGTPGAATPAIGGSSTIIFRQ